MVICWVIFRRVNLYFYTSCTLTTLKIYPSFICAALSLQKLYNFFSEMWGVYSFLWDNVCVLYIHTHNRVQVWRRTWPLVHLQQQGSCHLDGVFGVVMLGNSFWREGIIFCFRMSQYMLESMFPSMNRSSPVPAVVMQSQTMMLPHHAWL